MASNIELMKQITSEKLKRLSDVSLVWFIEVAEAGLRNDEWKDHKDIPVVHKVLKMLRAEMKRRK